MQEDLERERGRKEREKERERQRAQRAKERDGMSENAVVRLFSLRPHHSAFTENNCYRLQGHSHSH